MKRKFILFFCTALFCCYIIEAKAKLTLKEIRTASNTTLVAFFTSDTFDVYEANIEDLSKWKLNGNPVQNIYRFATQTDFKEHPLHYTTKEVVESKNYNCDHHIYLEIPELKAGKKYVLQTPYGKRSFVFNEEKIFCESIKTNQAGYSALAKTRYANFAIWLGTGGSRKIEGELPDYKIIEQFTHKIIAAGKLSEWGYDESSGDYVYRIDLSEAPEGGPYKVVVNGFGCSYPFGVGGEFAKRTAHTIFRGQYFQRCGCPIVDPPIREKACHVNIYDVDGPIGEANIEVKGDERVFKCYGGYHDAGDADRRAYHLSNPIINLMIYEAFPEVFFDEQFDIPGEFDENYNILSNKNNVPDIIDEAEWGTLAWEYLQNEDGSVHFGTETIGYPEPFANSMDKDDKNYGTVVIDPRATCTCAGLFMHLARLIKPFNPKRTKELMTCAEKAMEFGKEDIADPEKLYFYIQKYLLTQDEAAHCMVKQLYPIVDSLKYNLFLTPGYSLNDQKFDNPAYIFSYIIEEDVPTDPNIVNFFMEAIKAAADSNISVLKSHAYPIGNNSEVGGWGHNVRQPLYACAPILYWRLTKEQKYMDAASELMDWKLGLNPMGISYVSKLGFNCISNPHSRESAYREAMGYGHNPGITVFGPGIIAWYMDQTSIDPPANALSKERLYTNDLNVISFNEFTIFETMTHDALYTVLANGGKWSGLDPYK